MSLVCDTGPLLAALDAADPDHGRCVRLLGESPDELVVPALVLAEVDYWCHRRLTPAAWLTFLQDVLDGAYTLEPVTETDLGRCHQLQATYDDLGLGVVDASVIALVERLGEPRVATLDQRHFRAVRPRHVAALHLLP
jgi:hypothetical protein